MDTTPRLGQLVFSKAGRDRGRALVVVGIVDERHVWVADGEGHPAAHPKRKNVRHLAGAAAVWERVARGEPTDDAALRAWLSEVGAGRPLADGAAAGTDGAADSGVRVGGVGAT